MIAAYTFGHLVGELVRRVTGRPVSELLRAWVATPLGIEGELYFGVPTESLPGLAHLEEAPPWPVVPDDTILAPWEARPSVEFGERAEILSADIPSVGTATARALAAMFEGLLRGVLVDSAPVGAVRARLRGDGRGLRHSGADGAGLPDRQDRGARRGEVRRVRLAGRRRELRVRVPRM